MPQDDWTITLTGQDFLDHANGDSLVVCSVAGRTHSGGSWIDGVNFNISVVPELQLPEQDTALNAPIDTLVTTASGQPTSLDALTNQNKIVTYSFDEPTKPNPTGTWTGVVTKQPQGYFMQWQKEYPQNTNFSSGNPNWSNQDKTYTVNFNEPVHKPQGRTGAATGTQFTQTVTGNGEVKVETTDLAGNPVDSIQWEQKIDKAVWRAIPSTAVLTSQSMSYTVSNIIVGIEEVEQSNFKLYPNPVRDVLIIENGELSIKRC
jgi:hypothetical protein